MRQRLLPHLPLCLILLLALLLRIWGLSWGLPNAEHYFSYHPDESIILGASLRMNLLQGKLLPHFYNYGSLQLYLILFANTFAYLFGHGALIITNFAAQYRQFAQMYLAGRWLTVIMGVGTCWGVYAVGTRLWSQRAGLLSAFVLAIMPLHVQHSHWMTVDVPAAFWMTLSLVWTAKLAVSSDPKPLRAALLAGLFGGLAAATKYNLALILLPLIAASVLLGLQNRKEIRRWLCYGFAGLATSALAFLAACPGFFLDSRIFWKDFDYEAYHVRHLPGLTFADTGNGFVYQIVHNLDPGLGISLLLLSLLAVGYACWKRDRGDLLLAAFFVPFYILISVVIVRYTRYTIPLLPILALWVGRMCVDISGLPFPLLRRALAAAVVVVLLLTAYNTFVLIRPMAFPDNRDVAYAVLEKMNPPTIGFATQPWFGDVPVSPYFCAPIPGSWRAQTPPALLQKIICNQDWDSQSLGTLRPPVVVLSEYDYDDSLRLRVPAALAYVQSLHREYNLSRVIAGPDGVPAAIDGMPTRGLPTDMLYTDPIISIYTRK